MPAYLALVWAAVGLLAVPVHDARYREDGAGDRLGGLALLAVVLVALAPDGVAWAGTGHTYRMVDLGTLGGASSGATAVNDRDEVVGWSLTATGAQHPFLWRRGTMVDLGTLGGRDAMALDVNNRGEVVGWSYTADGQQHPFVWRNGVLTDPGTPGTMGAAVAINDRGQIAGGRSDPDGSMDAVLWDRGRVVDLGLEGAADLNDRGQVVGMATLWASDAASLWQRGTVTKLGTAITEPLEINNRGWIVGVGPGPWSPRDAVLWRAGVVTVLPTLGGRYSQPRDLNDRGQVLGLASTADFQTRAVLWQGGTVIDLSTRGIALNEIGTNVAALNNAAHIARQKADATGAAHAVLYR